MDPVFHKVIQVELLEGSLNSPAMWNIMSNHLLQVRKGHFKIYQKVDVLDKQYSRAWVMGVLLTEEEQQKCEQNTCLSLFILVK